MDLHRKIDTDIDETTASMFEDVHRILSASPNLSRGSYELIVKSLQDALLKYRNHFEGNIAQMESKLAEVRSGECLERSNLKKENTFLKQNISVLSNMMRSQNIDSHKIQEFGCFAEAGTLNGIGPQKFSSKSVSNSACLEIYIPDAQIIESEYGRKITERRIFDEDIMSAKTNEWEIVHTFVSKEPVLLGKSGEMPIEMANTYLSDETNLSFTDRRYYIARRVKQ